MCRSFLTKCRTTYGSILGNSEIWGKSQSWLEVEPQTQCPVLFILVRLFGPIQFCWNFFLCHINFFRDCISYMACNDSRAWRKSGLTYNVRQNTWNKEIKQSWTGAEYFGFCYCVLFYCYLLTFISKIFSLTKWDFPNFPGSYSLFDILWGNPFEKFVWLDIRFCFNCGQLNLC